MNRQSTALSLGASALILFSAFAVPALAAGTSSSAPLPEALRPALYQALAKDTGPAYAIGEGACATLSKQSFTACFKKGSVHFKGKNVPALTLRLAGYGRPDQLVSIKPVAPAIQANRAAYEHGNVTEWWRVLPMGFEQGFTVAARPVGHGELTLALAASRGAASHGKDLAWGKLSYGKLVVTDATGKIIPATMTSEGDHVVIAVNDARAAYPLTVDPLVWLKQKVTASGERSYAEFGTAVALDGTTALIGAPYHNRVYVFTESDGTWTQAQELAPGDPDASQFGSSIALHGSTAIIGDPGLLYYPEAAYVFTKSNGTWSETQELTESPGGTYDYFGGAVAFDGSTALIGAPWANIGDNDGQGAVYVFTNSNGVWTQGQEITVSDGTAHAGFGYGIAMEGTTALITGGGSVYAFSESGGSWTQLQELAIPCGCVEAGFLTGIALQGTTALVGVPYAFVGPDVNQGAAYILTQTDGVWSEGQELVAPDGGDYDFFGLAVALDGATAVVGSVGDDYWSYAHRAYVFTDSGGNWEMTRELYSDSTDYDAFGVAVALDAGTLLVGADDAKVGNNNDEGDAYFFRQSDLGLAMSAPGSVGQGQTYVSQTIATNNATTVTPAVAVTVAVPAAASFISANATQGSCSEDSGVVTCSFGQIVRNGGTATANVTLKATGDAGTTIENTASVSKATPALTANAPTLITQSNCPDGYSEYDGTLAAGTRAIEPDGQPYDAPAGMENGILNGPEGFRLYAAYRGTSGHWRMVPAPGNELHRRGPAGSYAWIVKAGASGGAFVFCLNHP